MVISLKIVLQLFSFVCLNNAIFCVYLYLFVSTKTHLVKPPRYVFVYNLLLDNKRRYK